MSERDEPPCVCFIEALSYDECPAHPDDPAPEREAELRRRAAIAWVVLAAYFWVMWKAPHPW